MSSLLENMKRTTRAQLDAYNKWDLDAIMTPRADDCVYRYLPESMNRPPMNNEQFREYFASILPLLQGFDVTMSHEVYDEQARTSVCHGFSTATSVLGAYKMEMFILMELNQTGEKIVKIDEMVDSAYISDYLARLTAHMQAQGQTA